MELPPFPKEFSREARKAVIDAEVLACRTLRENLYVNANFTRFYRSDSTLCGNKYVIHAYVLPVFLVFAKQACLLGHLSNNPWFSDRITSVVLGFLKQLIVRVPVAFGREGFPILSMTDSFSDATNAVTDVIEASPEWKEYQDLLLDVGKGVPIANLQPVPNRVGYRKEIVAWMKSKNLTQNLAAKKLGISIDVLKSIMSDRGRRRYSEETLSDVLTKIGIKRE